ncbi:amino acid/amide ABC transporter ATP-binding protein 1, HAAT family [Roseovarius pacificus]|uniref:Amino acid/amide ABC transporter ATP-binding protein 1, HAAT family n=1 Tax=Roseovarius pacificus TaxID=337701 RepID=A0A1M7JE59_9RHOB|nr:ABC transporter ATP-binding protein [Roseovarius pacificus]GGO61908.1 ABC transporter ATP-binding protein [Roseovarius pacificus]SHM51161.1 amino acid/amide ABC transporter ATP-binding protein 1, HAAT family [Roseovarius pacificus]
METEKAILKTRGLTRSFSGFVAVNDVNFAVKEGSIHALIGPNGAGKSTLFNLLTRFLSPSSGQIFYDGSEITHASPANLARQGLVRSFQISSVFPHLSVLENVRIALQSRHGETMDFWLSDRRLKKYDDEVMALLADIGLETYAKRIAVELPYGRKRALELATTLAMNPRVILLDEPMAGMGQEDIQRTAALIQKVAKGRTVLMVEHNLSVVADISDMITVLRRGEIIAEGTYDIVSANPEVRQAYIGGSHD